MQPENLQPGIDADAVEFQYAAESRGDPRHRLTLCHAWGLFHGVARAGSGNRQLPAGFLVKTLLRGQNLFLGSCAFALEQHCLLAMIDRWGTGGTQALWEYAASHLSQRLLVHAVRHLHLPAGSNCDLGEETGVALPGDVWKMETRVQEPAARLRANLDITRLVAQHTLRGVDGRVLIHTCPRRFLVLVIDRRLCSCMAGSLNIQLQLPAGLLVKGLLGCRDLFG